MKTLLTFASAIVVALAFAAPANADDYARKHLSNPNGSVTGSGGAEFSKGGKGGSGNGYNGGGNAGSYRSGKMSNAGYGAGGNSGGGYNGGGSWGGNSGGGLSHSAPGPILGLGLPALAIAGGYVFFRRRAKK